VFEEEEGKSGEEHGIGVRANAKIRK